MDMLTIVKIAMSALVGLAVLRFLVFEARHLSPGEVIAIPLLGAPSLFFLLRALWAVQPT